MEFPEQEQIIIVFMGYPPDRFYCLTGPTTTTYNDVRYRGWVRRNRRIPLELFYTKKFA